MVSVPTPCSWPARLTFRQIITPTQTNDIWETDKLQRAVARLSAVPHGTPAVYCSRTRVVDANDQPICMSPLFAKTPRFANALMQNIGGGNTMVFNEAVRQLLIKAGQSI